MKEKNRGASETKDDTQSSLGLFGYSLPKTILLVILAGFVYEASQYGKGRLDQIARWIDGEEHTLPIDTPTVEKPTIPGVSVVKSDAIKIGSFQFSIQKEWLAVESEDLNYVYSINPRFAGLLNSSFNGAKDKSPFLLSTPKIYTITLPSEAGHIFSLHQRVFLKTSNDAKDVIAALDAITEQQRKNTSFVTGPGTLSPAQNAIVSGAIDKDMVSPDDVFQAAFTNQLYQLSQIQNDDSQVSVKRTRITQSDSYTIAEIDYAYTLEQEHRMSAVLYWDYDEGTPWGDLGIFIVELNEKPASKIKKALRKTFSSLHLQTDDHEIWNDLNYDASTDTKIMSFVHVDIDTRRLRSFGLNVKQVEEILVSSLPIKMKEIEHITVANKNGHQVYLEDVAIIQPLTNKEEQIFNIDSLLLTVRP